MTKKPDPAGAVRQLVDNFKSAVKAAHDALGPGQTQKQRNKIRESLGGYLAETTQKPANKKSDLGS
jgi:hypothetical protein